MKTSVIVCCLFGADAFHPGHKVLPHLPRELKKRLRNSRLLAPFDASAVGSSAGLRVTPTAYGGDPTGQK
jgi:hypothetical protein